MPRKITIRAEQILDAAFELVRREGLGAMSARTVAGEAGCSTQPVYRAYQSMEQLRSEVIARAEELALRFLMANTSEDRPYLQVGLGALRFARDEPNLFDAVTRHGRVLRDLQRGAPPPPEILARMRTDPILAQLSNEQLTRIHGLMWFFSQGLAHLVLGESSDAAMEKATTYLDLAGRAVIAFELSGGD